MNRSVSIAIFLFSVLIASVSQLLLKLSAQKKYSSRLSEYLNPLVIGGYSIFLLSTLLTMLAYRSIPLSLGTVLEASGYFYVFILGILVLHEKVNTKKVIGNVLILTGIGIFYIFRPA